MRKNLLQSTEAIVFKARGEAKNKAKLVFEEAFEFIDTDKEQPRQYHLNYVTYDPQTRITKASIIQTKTYRTIDKYITRDYVRYPVYSSWKTKTKCIDKSLKLTNKNLEQFYSIYDELTSFFAEKIILSTNDDNIIPSWLYKELYQREKKYEIQLLDSDIEQLNSNFNIQERNLMLQIQNNNKAAAPIKNTNAKLKKHIEKVERKLNKISNSKKSVFLKIITLFIYAYLVSNKRVKILQKNKFAHAELLQNNVAILTSFEEKNQVIENIRKENKEKLDKDITEVNQQKKTVKDYFLEKIKNIVPLPLSIETDDFTPLSNLSGMQLEKIIGCYVIRNRNNKKCYVGQSKDVLKRIKQHFKGTTPQNIIFAEDYYATDKTQRDNLFELKVIPLNTKDELDKKEKDLIEEYDSFRNGYNGTGGNQ